MLSYPVGVARTPQVSPGLSVASGVAGKEVWKIPFIICKRKTVTHSDWEDMCVSCGIITARGAGCYTHNVLHELASRGALSSQGLHGEEPLRNDSKSIGENAWKWGLFPFFFLF